MSKPVKEWTLEEAQAYCRDFYGGDGCACREDQCRLAEYGYRVCCNEPKDWELTDAPRWTPEEVEKARAIKLLWPGAETIYIGGTGNVRVNVRRGERSSLIFEVALEHFPSLRAGEDVRIESIINGGR